MKPVLEGSDGIGGSKGPSEVEMPHLGWERKAGVKAEAPGQVASTAQPENRRLVFHLWVPEKGLGPF